MVRGFSASRLTCCRSSGFRKRCSGEGASLSRGDAVLRKPSNDEDREGYKGLVGFDHCGSSVMIFPSNPVIREKGLNFVGTLLPPLSPSIPVLPNSVIQSQYPMKNRVTFEIFSKKDDVGTLCQVSVGNPNLDVVESQFALLNQMPEGFNPLKSMPNMPNEVSNLVIVSQGEAKFFSLGKFQIEGLSPKKMAKVREILSSLNIKVYSRWKNRFSTGI
ncbi:hypothetical protein AAG906_021434 [Vitis piasezkii]